ncbi:MAG: hypothetical protein LBO20_09055, partial [Bifidobacteriaceae bacterium]|nr:hypothetical protein [Bifidobacteriaceae bacterium]
MNDSVNGSRAGTGDQKDTRPTPSVGHKDASASRGHRSSADAHDADVLVPFRMATPTEIAKASWVFTTCDDGLSIRIREPLSSADSRPESWRPQTREEFCEFLKSMSVMAADDKVGAGK